MQNHSPGMYQIMMSMRIPILCLSSYSIFHMQTYYSFGWESEERCCFNFFTTFSDWRWIFFLTTAFWGYISLSRVFLLHFSLLFLSERARNDAIELDYQAKDGVKRLRYVALVSVSEARYGLSNDLTAHLNIYFQGLEESVSFAAMEHWNDGQLDVSLPNCLSWYSPR